MLGGGLQWEGRLISAVSFFNFINIQIRAGLYGSKWVLERVKEGKVMPRMTVIIITAL